MKKKHFVQFLSPGTFSSESTVKEIDSWDIEKAKLMSQSIVERYGARPYGFRFFTEEKSNNESAAQVTATSGIYFLGGTLLSLADIIARNDPNDQILISNMQMNSYDFVIVNENSYKITLPFSDNDHLLTQAIDDDQI